jgi:hypothetical protein
VSELLPLIFTTNKQITADCVQVEKFRLLMAEAVLQKVWQKSGKQKSGNELIA